MSSVSEEPASIRFVRSSDPRFYLSLSRLETRVWYSFAGSMDAYESFKEVHICQVPGVRAEFTDSKSLLKGRAYVGLVIEEALESNPRSATDTTVRHQAWSELYLARALYRCGDYQGLGEKILREYARDLHGHYARHAKAILNTPPGPVD